MKRSGGFQYALVNPNKQVRGNQPMTKEERLAAARRRQQQLVQAGVRPQYLALAGGKSNMNELKGVGGNFDLTPILATTNTNGSISVMNLIQQGAGSWNRVGRKVRLRSLRFKGNIQFYLLTGLGIMSQNAVRITLVHDKQPSGAAIPTFDTIFGETDQTGAESSSYLSGVRYDNTSRFTVLKDMVTTSQFNVPQANPESRWQVPFDVFVNLKKIETVFSGQSNPMTIADISTGALYLVFRARANGVTQYAEISNSTFRLRYED